MEDHTIVYSAQPVGANNKLALEEWLCILLSISIIIQLQLSILIIWFGRRIGWQPLLGQGQCQKKLFPVAANIPPPIQSFDGHEEKIVKRPKSLWGQKMIGGRRQRPDGRGQMAISCPQHWHHCPNAHWYWHLHCTVALSSSLPKGAVITIKAAQAKNLLCHWYC